jgi:hypothetical protein
MERQQFYHNPLMRLVGLNSEKYIGDLFLGIDTTNKDLILLESFS